MKIKKQEFIKLALSKNISGMKNLIKLAMTLEHSVRPRLDDIRAWATNGQWRIDGTNRGAFRHG